MIFLRAEAHSNNDAKMFIKDAAMQLNELTNKKLLIFGPIPALIEKRNGRYRYQLIIQSQNRKILHKYINVWLEKLESSKLGKKIRWSLDVDPQDMN
tara:strand:- start:373 stop:663 length:291 start_codon:yes stop_codon:yes gene_type:complete